jgi:hypothetical protein
MGMPLVISFYTRHTPYAEEITRLRRSCQEHGLALHVEGLPSTGCWVRNCALKGPFVWQCLQQFDQPLLWLDADAEVLRYPELFQDPEFEFAAYQPAHLCSGTLYFAQTAGSRQLARAWADLCLQGPRTWDQVLLARVLEQARGSVRFRCLPQGYCKVIGRRWREADQTTYILHHQASRRFKRQV